MESIPIGSTNNLLGLAAIVVCIAIVAFLSSSEASLISVNRIRIRNLKEKRDKRAEIVNSILSEHERLFGTILLTENFFIILATSLGTAILLNILGEDGWWIASLIMTVLVVLIGEITPKTIAVSHADSFALRVARPIRFLIKVTHPVVWFFTRLPGWLLKTFGAEIPTSPFITEEDIKTMIDLGEESGSLMEEEKEMLHKVFEFGDTIASETMVPRTDIVSVKEDAVVSEALELVREKGFSRYPVIREKIDNIVGILYIKDILIKMSEDRITDETPIKEFIRDAYFIPENKKVSELLNEMQKKKFQIAIVMDEYGGTAGLITLEDLMEEIVGSLQDEFEKMEAEKDVEVIDERTFIVAGSTPLDEAGDLLDIKLESSDFHTVGGFVFGLFGRLPKEGEQIRYHNLRFLILEMDGRKVAKLKITKL
jgi:CBS domain containing-hemolysin-like protein